MRQNVWTCDSTFQNNIHNTGKKCKKKKKIIRTAKKKKYLFQKSIGVYLHTRTLLAATELNFKKKRKKTFFALSRDWTRFCAIQLYINKMSLPILITVGRYQSSSNIRSIDLFAYMVVANGIDSGLSRGALLSYLPSPVTRLSFDYRFCRFCKFLDWFQVWTFQYFGHTNWISRSQSESHIRSDDFADITIPRWIEHLQSNDCLFYFVLYSLLLHW